MDSSVDDVNLEQSFSRPQQQNVSPNGYIRGSVFSPSFVHNNASFAKSWSLQFINGKVVPPLDQTTLTKEDHEMPYQTNRFSKQYIPYWISIISFFIMFLQYNLTQNLSPSVFGSDGSIAVGMVYIFFIVSSFITPTVLKFAAKNNASFLIFVGAMAYSLFTFSCIFAWLPFLLVGATAVGLCAGFVWISNAFNLVSLSRYISEQDFLENTRQRLAKRFPQDPSHAEANQHRIDQLIAQLTLPNGRVDMSKLTDEQMKRLIVSTAHTTAFLNSCSWIFLNLNTVCGGLIAYFVLGNENSSDAPPDAKVNAAPLFILFTIVALIANVLYYIAYTKHPPQMYDPVSQGRPLAIPQHNEQRRNTNKDIVESIPPADLENGGGASPRLQRNLSPVMETAEDEESENPFNTNHHYDSAMEQSTQQFDTPNNNAFATDYNSTNPFQSRPTSGSGSGQLRPQQTQYTLHSYNSTLSSMSTDSNHIDQSFTQQEPTTAELAAAEQKEAEKNPLLMLWESMILMFCLLKQRVIFTSIPGWIQSSMPNNFVYSLYTANVIKHALGIESVPIVIILVAAIDAVAAFVLTKYMKTFFAARLCGMLGSTCQLAALTIILFGPTLSADAPGKAWAWAIVTAAFTGVGDAVHQSGGNAALGMVAENNRVRSAAFSVCQVAKSVGSVFLFFSVRVIGFWPLTWILFFTIIVSLLAQAFCWYYHLPIDVDYVVAEFEHYANGGKDEDVAKMKDNDATTTLEGLGSTDKTNK